MKTLLFVYGTLKRGCCNHAQLAGQEFIAEARTEPGFRLHDLGGFPTLVARADDRGGVTGEVWAVDDAALARLDAFEGVHEGLYRRAPIALQPPFGTQRVDAYLSAQPAERFREVGSTWRE